MTKKQLIKKLEKVNDNTEIILASDEEGNSYYEIGEVYKEKGLKCYEYDGISLVTEEDISSEYENLTQETYDNYKNCVVLYPK